MFSYFKNRSLRAEILAIFLFLIAFVSISIISFTYSRTSRSILDFSMGMIEQASNLIIEKIDDLIRASEDLAEESLRLIFKPEDLSFNNQELIAYMLQVANDNPELYGFYFARPDGSLLNVVNLESASQTHFVYSPSKPLPKESRFVFHVVDRSQPQVSDTWYYVDENLKTIVSESNPNAHPVFNSTTRPWYTGAVQAKGGVYWTPIYTFEPFGEAGISVSKARFGPDGNLIVVASVDISLDLFSHYLTEQKIGKTGKAFILNTSGKMIVSDIVSDQGITKEVVQAAYDYHAKTKREDFIFKSGKVKYLASADPFPIKGTFDWIILVIAPLDDFMGALFETQFDVVLISLLIMGLASLFVVFFSKRISGPIVTLSKETNKIRHLDFESETRVRSNIREIKLMDDSIAAMRIAIRSFGRYIPKEIVMQLINKGCEIEIGGEKKEIAIFFSDIEGFTPITETENPEEITALLSEYFDGLSKIILKHQGNIDKYIGDGIMAIWGAPKELAGYDIHACRAAIECQTYLTALNKRLKSEGKPVLITRIGIDSGEAIVGNVGTSERMNFTAMGNPVNTASRLQNANKLYHTKILISEHVKKKIGEEFLTRPIDIAELKGQKEKKRIFELMDKSDPAQIELAALFTQALEAYQENQRSEAKALFLKIQKKYPKDIPTEIYLKRL